MHLAVLQRDRDEPRRPTSLSSAAGSIAWLGGDFAKRDDPCMALPSTQRGN